MKIIYITTIGATMNFFKEFIKKLICEGHIVDIATNEDTSSVPAYYRKWGCKVHQIDTSRSPLNKGNLVAIKQIRQLAEQNKYDIVHCHTPVAALCTRIACRRARENGTRVFYTAHGFHFYKGAPLKNWLLYYPVEWLCAYFTDTLITINQEDYAFAQKKLNARKVVYVPGVGIDMNKFSKVAVDKADKKKELGIPKDVLLLLSVGELNENKNHETVIRAVAAIKDVYYIIAGEGDLHGQLQGLIDELNLSERVKLLGYRSDIGELCICADVYVMPSFREGLPVALMEAMAIGLPCVVSKVRGNTDLIDENGGKLFDPNSVEDCRSKIESLITNGIGNIGVYNMTKIRRFSLERVNEQMTDIYTQEVVC